MTGNLDLGRNSIKNFRDPALGSDACTKGYVDRSVNTLTTEVTSLNNSVNRLNVLCIKATGVEVDIDMQNHKFHNLLDPEKPQDSATKAYVDNGLFADRLIGSLDVNDPINLNIIRLTSNPGNTINVVADIAFICDSNIKHISKATQLVSALLAPKEEGTVPVRDSIPLLNGNKIFYLNIDSFIATDLEIYATIT
jgi:hypothetical protein